MLRLVLAWTCCAGVLTPPAASAQRPSVPPVAGPLTLAPPRKQPEGAPGSPRIVVNDNRAPAGRPGAGGRTIRLEAKAGTWYPEGDAGPGLQVAAFAEEGGPASVPGPLLRMPVGTEVRARVRNSLSRPLVVRGLHPHGGMAADSLTLAPGQAREVRFRASTPGTYFYRGRIAGERGGPGSMDDSQLVGAFIVDPPGTARGAGDRILLISAWTDRTDTVSTPGHRPLHTIVVNGLSWPHTERLTYTVGDSVHWRVINGTGAPHPMHLHGFYYRVDSRGDSLRDTIYTPAERRTIVTEFMAPGTTMAMSWVPKRPGNWLFHCHLIAHVSTELRLGGHGSHAGGHRSGNHALDGMAGLVTGIHIRLKPGETIAEPDGVPRRKLRAFINARPGYFGDRPGIGFVLQEGPTEPAADSMRMPGSSLVFTRGEPVEVAVHNRTQELVSVHWHGIELDSYFDGVGDWSGDAGRVAPPIAPGDSFVVRMTPDRAGTFIYHTHMEEGQQLNSGLYGPLIVLEPGEVIDRETDHVLLLGWYGPGPDAAPAINGDPTPEPLEMKLGKTYRLRFINITPSAVERVALLAASVPQRWRAFAKDGAQLPLHQATFQAARQRIGPGETYDFEFTPGQAGDLVLETEVRVRGEVVKTVRVPVYVR